LAVGEAPTNCQPRTKRFHGQKNGPGVYVKLPDGPRANLKHLVEDAEMRVTMIRGNNMTIFASDLRLGLLAACWGFALAPSAFGQAPATYAGQPQFRDPKTGQIWTPENVGGRSGPNTPADRAFDPLGQTIVVKGVVTQTPGVTVLGSVPITAGPTVPIATIDDASLSAIPSQRWQVVLYLNNNSAGAISPTIDCRFTNAGNPVDQARANLPPIGPGQRVGLTIYGPRTNVFVDRAECGLAPI